MNKDNLNQILIGYVKLSLIQQCSLLIKCRQEKLRREKYQVIGEEYLSWWSLTWIKRFTLKMMWEEFGSFWMGVLVNSHGWKWKRLDKFITKVNRLLSYDLLMIMDVLLLTLTYVGKKIIERIHLVRILRYSELFPTSSSLTKAKNGWQSCFATYLFL